jgi:pSer/pThr/pTyr-binding forkhead associated (FHA) protein
MQVKLRIIKGPNQGKEVRIPTPRCVIGRGEGSHIKAKSDAVSRNHCEIITNAKEVIVRDLNSRNGTLVNDERTKGDTPLLSGDILRVGPLEFEIILEVEAKVNNPAVNQIKNVLEKAAAHDPGSNGTTVELTNKVDKWMNEADVKSKGTPETRQFKFEETDGVLNGISLDAKDGSKTQEELKAELEKKKKEEEDKKKKPPGKLPPIVPQQQSKNSRDAAGDFLKRMFGK